MPEINIPQPNNVDIYSFGFDRNLNKEARLDRNPLVYDSVRDLLQAQSVQFGNLSVGSRNSVFQVDPTKGIWLGNEKFESAPFNVDMAGRMKYLGASSITMKSYTIMETAARFVTSVVGSGSIDFLTGNGVLSGSGITASSSTNIRWNQTGNVFLGSPTFSCLVRIGVAANASHYVGLGEPLSGASHDFNLSHIGFKVVGGNLSATQANGTSETTQVLTSVVASDDFDLILRMNGNTSVEYFFRKNNGTMSDAAILKTNIPTASSVILSYSLTNTGTTTDVTSRIYSTSYER